jgi:hypothetical protein
VDTGITTHAILAVVTPFLGIIAFGKYAALVAGQEGHAGLRLICIDPVVGMPVAHHLRVVAVAKLIEISDVRFDASGTDDHVRIILQDLEFLVTSLGLPGQLSNG